MFLLRSSTSACARLLLIATLGGCGGLTPGAPAGEATSRRGDPRVVAAEPRPSAGPPFALPPDQVASAVAISASCLIDDSTGRTARSLYFDERYIDDGLMGIRDGVACLAASTDGCISMRRCVGASAHVTSRCTPGCDGDTAIGCDDLFVYRIDCAARALSCDPERGRCVRTPGEPCDAATFSDKCEEGRPVQCLRDGLHRGPECASFGLRCAVGDHGALCIGAGGECVTDTHSGLGFEIGEGTCRDARTLETCINGGTYVADCSAAGPGFACRTIQRGGRSVSFCGLADECDPEERRRPTEPGQCDGEHMILCNVGRIDRVDCRSLGFDGCSARAGRCGPGLITTALEHLGR